MPTVKLTALTVANARVPAKGRVELWDAALPGFGLRITQKGAKSWTVLYRFRGRLRRLTLGRYPAMLLIDARDRARDVLRAVAKGTDPATAKAEERQREADLFQSVIAEFIERHAKPNNRGWQRQERDLRREFLPYWQNRPIGSIGRRDIIELLDRIADRTSPQRANRYLALVKKLVSWCAERGVIDTSPAVNIKPPGKALSRDRVLSGDEIALFWRCCDEAGWPFGDLFQLLLVTAQRLGEIAGATWGDIDFDRAIWTVPAAVAKNGVANEVPLSPLAIGILRSAPTFSGDGFVFPARNGSGNPASGFSKSKARLDAAMGPIPPWRLHDLRRSAASGMAELAIPVHVIEKVLNHTSGSLAGVAGVYNRHGYLPEKRHALETWSVRIEALTGQPAPSNVVPLVAAAG
jgi:integrase